MKISARNLTISNLCHPTKDKALKIQMVIPNNNNKIIFLPFLNFGYLAWDWGSAWSRFLIPITGLQPLGLTLFPTTCESPKGWSFENPSVDTKNSPYCCHKDEKKISFAQNPSIGVGIVPIPASSLLCLLSSTRFPVTCVFVGNCANKFGPWEISKTAQTVHVTANLTPRKKPSSPWGLLYCKMGKTPR